MDAFVKRKKTDTSDNDEPAAKKSPVKMKDDEQNLLRIPYQKLANEQAVEDHFAHLAETLINDAVLVANGVRHRIAELEFYYNTAVFPDPFPHGDELQRTAGQWYFHRTGGTYRAGTFKGLDITIGTDSKNYGLEVIEGGAMLCGPCVSVDHILKVCKVDSIKSLVESSLKGDISITPASGKALYLELSPSKKPNKRTILRSARVGLHMNKASIDGQTQKHFVFKDKKITKGRNLAILQLASEGKSAGDIHTATFGTMAMLTKVLEAFDKGKTKGKANSYVGSKFNDEDIPVAFGAIWAEENAAKK